MSEILDIRDLRGKFEAFGACAIEVDGHNVEEIVKAAETPHPGKPLFVICRTNATKGVEIMDERRPSLHYCRFNDEATFQRYKADFEKKAAAAGYNYKK
jgi:transketolase